MARSCFLTQDTRVHRAGIYIKTASHQACRNINCCMQVWQLVDIDATSFVDSIARSCFLTQDTRVHRAGIHAVAAAFKSIWHAGTVNSLCHDCLVTRRFVLTWNRPRSARPLQSERSDWLPRALYVHWDCPYIECPYKESLLYTLHWTALHKRMHQHGIPKRLSHGASLSICLVSYECFMTCLLCNACLLTTLLNSWMLSVMPLVWCTAWWHACGTVQISDMTFMCCKIDDIPDVYHAHAVTCYGMLTS